MTPDPGEQYLTVVDRTENQKSVSIASPYTDIFVPVPAQCVNKLTITRINESHQEITIHEFRVFATIDDRYVDIADTGDLIMPNRHYLAGLEPRQAALFTGDSKLHHSR